MGVVVRRYIDILTITINFPYSTCISSFFSSSIPSLLLCSFLKCFFGLVSVIFLQYISKRYSKSIRDRSKKSRSREYNYLIISIIGERSEPPLSVELSEFSLFYIYIYLFIYIFQAVRRTRAVNAQRANVGPVELQWSI